MSLFGWGGRKDEQSSASSPTLAESLLEGSFTGKATNQLNLLSKMVCDASAAVSPTVYSQLRAVDDIMRPLVKYIETHPVDAEHEYAINAILTNYIPTSLTTFLALTSEEQVDNGQADLLLQKQYATILNSTYGLAEQIKTAGLQELSIQADFIENRFSQGV